MKSNMRKQNKCSNIKSSQEPLTGLAESLSSVCLIDKCESKKYLRLKGSINLLKKSERNSKHINQSCKSHKLFSKNYN